ncbi:hypothetical protein [Paenibacillus wenxiniae]|uniref:HEAT repeat domain-containing protein n=1 Tax=Paenibacillus wenxiniae TaxID=1636843 RepID=A0ABW4RRP5_9BACL
MSERLHDWQQCSTDERLQALLRIDSALDVEEIQLLLDTAQHAQSDDILQIECWKVLGLYSEEPHKAQIRTAIHQHWMQEQDEEYVQIAMLEALTALHVQTEDIDLALSIVQSDEYILIRSAAFSLLRLQRHLPQVRHALEQLRDDPDFGNLAVKLLQEK